MKGLKHYKHSVGQNAYHIVFCPKYRKPILKHNVKIVTEALFVTLQTRYKFKIYEMQVMPDHIHLFVEIPPVMSISKALQLIKGYTSYALFKLYPWLRYTFTKGHLWSQGKFFRSVGNVTSETIEHYIRESQNGWN